MIAKWSDKIRIQSKFFAEPILLTAAEHQGNKHVKKLSRSKYIRLALIEKLFRDEYPLSEISSKFNGFRRAMVYNH